VGEKCCGREECSFGLDLIGLKLLEVDRIEPCFTRPLQENFFGLHILDGKMSGGENKIAIFISTKLLYR
jgi:hypothetical protein